MIFLRFLKHAMGTCDNETSNRKSRTLRTRLERNDAFPSVLDRTFAKPLLNDNGPVSIVRGRKTMVRPRRIFTPSESDRYGRCSFVAVRVNAEKTDTVSVKQSRSERTTDVPRKRRTNGKGHRNIYRYFSLLPYVCFLTIA